MSSFFAALVYIEELTPDGTQKVLYNDADFEMTCIASGSNIYQVTWFKDDRALVEEYFNILGLESIRGFYEYDQKMAVKSVVRRKVEGLSIFIYIIQSTTQQNTLRMKSFIYRITLSAMAAGIPLNDVIKPCNSSKIVNFWGYPFINANVSCRQQ